MGDILNEFLRQSLADDGGLRPNAVTSQTIAPGAVKANNLYSTSDWITPSEGIPGTDKQDPVTGLIWSQRLWRNGDGVVQFHATNFTSFSWDNSLAANAGRTAIELCSDMGNGW